MTDEYIKTRNEKILALWNQGLSGSKVAQRLGITRSAVLGVIHRARANGALALIHECTQNKGLPKKQAIAQREINHQEIIDRWNAGMSSPDIAKLTGLTASSVRGIIDRARIKGKEVVVRSHRLAYSVMSDEDRKAKADLEKRIIALSVQGYSRKEVAFKTGISVTSVQNVVKRAQRAGTVVPDGREAVRIKSGNVAPVSVVSDSIVGRAVPAPAEAAKPVPFFELGARHCKFPLWGDQWPVAVSEMMCCGAEKALEESYCAHHQSIAYRPVPKPKPKPERVDDRSFAKAARGFDMYRKG